jgi:hypothetical protein
MLSKDVPHAPPANKLLQRLQSNFCQNCLIRLGHGHAALLLHCWLSTRLQHLHLWHKCADNPMLQ